MLSLALVVGAAGMARASIRSIDEWMTGTLNPDLFVTAAENLAATIPFPGRHAPELAAIPGVDEVQPVRTARIQFPATR